MESITLKELSAYLPYGVRYKDSYAGDISTRILNGNSIEHWKCGHIKPLILHLRPLSDLTKEIEVNGERFVPIEKLNIPYQLSINKNNIKNMPHRTFEKFLEWHFDVFGLIERGLASDIDLSDVDPNDLDSI